MWLNEGGIVNLVVIPQLERDMYRITYDTHDMRVVWMPDGTPIPFGHDGGGPMDHLVSIDLEDLEHQSLCRTALKNMIHK